MINPLSRRRFIQYVATGIGLGYGGAANSATPSSPVEYTIYVTPHSHIDIEWYWTYDKTQILAIRILQQALEMLKSDPHYAFTQDQMTALKPFWDSLSETDRDFLRRMIQEGRFEVATGTVVQPDVAEPDFESLTRQFLLAKPWLESTLGADIVTCWNIDTYGHTIQMPQLNRLAGLRYFVFMRDVLPSIQASVKSPFHWQGVDGTKILAYWLSGGYGVNPQNPAPTLRKFVQHNVSGNDKIMLLWGDDLYFPTQSSEQIESLVRKAGVEVGIQIKSVIVTTPRHYFEEIEKSGIRLPTYNYDFNPPVLIEDLRGLYGESPGGKIAERCSEDTLESAEKFSSITSFYAEGYPSEALRAAWWNVLFNQDHDVLPGSHIDTVEREMMSRYDEAIQAGRAAFADSTYRLSRIIDTSTGGDYPFLVYNALSCQRTELVRYELLFKEQITNFGIFDQEGKPVSFRLVDAARWEKNGPLSMAVVELVAHHMPSMGYRLYRIEGMEGSAGAPQWHSVSNEIANRFFTLRLDPQTGLISSLIDQRTGKELLSPENYSGNELVLEEERDPSTEGPLHFTGKEILSGQFPPDSMMELNDDLGTRIRIDRPFLDGRLVQLIDLYKELPRIDFVTKILGFPRHDGMLSVVFPLRFSGAIRNYYETNNAVTQRPDGIYYGQTFAAVEGPTRGTAIINRGMGGYHIQKGVVKHILLRSITNFKGYYCPQATQAGSHTFEYSLYSYEGGWAGSGLVAQAHSVNSPLRVMATDSHHGSLAPEHSFFSVETGNFEVTALKKAENGDGLILRGYETEGKPEAIRLRLHLPFKRAWVASLFEQPIRPASLLDGVIEFRCRPFEFVTLRLSAVP